MCVFWQELYTQTKQTCRALSNTRGNLHQQWQPYSNILLSWIVTDLLFYIYNIFFCSSSCCNKEETLTQRGRNGVCGLCCCEKSVPYMAYFVFMLLSKASLQRVCKLVQVQTLHEVLIPMSSTTAQWTRCGHQQTGDRVPPLTNLDILETEGSLVRGTHCLVWVSECGMFIRACTEWVRLVPVEEGAW